MIGWNDFKICLLSKNFFLKFQIGKCTLCWWSHLLHMSSQIFLFTTDASTCQHWEKAWVFTSKYLGKKVMTHWREKRHSLEPSKKREIVIWTDWNQDVMVCLFLRSITLEQWKTSIDDEFLRFVRSCCTFLASFFQWIVLV